MVNEDRLGRWYAEVGERKRGVVSVKRELCMVNNGGPVWTARRDGSVSFDTVWADVSQIAKLYFVWNSGSHFLVSLSLGERSGPPGAPSKCYSMVLLLFLKSDKRLLSFYF